ncbi:MAG: erythromycin esterase family protein [Lachnospiraceae bacterium]|nr:erythromycin esterase family protein [Lachnospiraceae bacterium]
MRKKTVCTMAMMLGLISLFTGCGKDTAANMELTRTDVSTITVPEDVLVVGLGESSHGVKEYQEMKADVFQALVQNNGCRTFVIEGDFGNALKVNAYIHGGEGTAEEAAALIGFRIYCTEEMETLLQWMRTYNETAPEGKDLNFYGMDMQWADSSKEYVFDILEQAVPGAASEYEEALAFLNDDDMYDISTETFAQGMPVAEKLIQEVDNAEAVIVEAFGSETFAFARECARSIYNCCDIRKSDSEYNEIRDGHMAEKVEWFLEHGDGSLIFINGHNGHIGRMDATLYYNCLGKLLYEELGDGYFAIGTDAEVTIFNSQTDDGFEEKKVQNSNDLNALAAGNNGNYYYVDFSTAEEDNDWNEILSKKQSITSLNVGGPTIIKAFYTTEIIPIDTFDGMIIYDKVSPTTLEL